MKEDQKSLIGNKVNELNDSPIPVDIPKMTSDISIATQPMPQYPSTGNNIGSLITINRNVVRDSYNSSVVNNAAGAAGAGAAAGASSFLLPHPTNIVAVIATAKPSAKTFFIFIIIPLS